MSDLDAMVDVVPEAPKIDVDEDGSIKDINVEALIAEFRDLRDELTLKSREFKEYKANTEARMDVITMKLKAVTESLGLTALKTAAGTAYRQVKENYRVGNWDEILNYIRETGNWQMLEKRIGKLATQEIYRETGKLPPGVEYSSEVEFVVRKNSN